MPESTCRLMYCTLQVKRKTKYVILEKILCYCSYEIKMLHLTAFNKRGNIVFRPSVYKSLNHHFNTSGAKSSRFNKCTFKQFT